MLLLLKPTILTEEEESVENALEEVDCDSATLTSATCDSSTLISVD